MHDKSAFTILVEPTDSGKRLDLYITSCISQCSRSVATNLIRKGQIRVKGMVRKPGYRVRAGDEISGCIPPPTPVLFKPEPIPIEILHEDNDIIVINKQAGLVVHPAPGHYSGTLVNALLYHCPKLNGIGGELRPGIVHRLDKDTSGVLVVAKNDGAHLHLSRQFKSRRVKKDYLALVFGKLESDSGSVSLPIGRHPVDRKKMSTKSRKGRVAETTWQIKERFELASLIKVHLKTGRTHQIRVHCAAVKHPVMGDKVYGPRKTVRNGAFGKNLFASVPRQMLHAWRIGFTHPVTEATVSFEAPIPSDMQAVIIALRQPERSVLNSDSAVKK
ncbi:MAG: RluA family pseudouridine synthase [Deltaproteobacteria bacterium]|jgi:23S rRNA pseudouridine1911/1915/1917 synthase|nr:RluA family pseudouridine synthase [Deltaproteobacteria bacterium]